MPSHWTYEKRKKPTGDLYQGDIIQRSERLLKVLGTIHKYFCDDKYLGFIVISQTCDLVVRGGECKAKYINLAVIRSLESMMPTFLGDACATNIPGVYYDDGRREIKELVTRIINQNEQALGLFYLEPDGDLKLAVESVALLRVSIALRSKEHYRIIKAARVGRLRSPFRNKLGWLVGNLFSRVDTPDWPEEIGKAEADRKVTRLIKDLDEDANNVWVPRHLFDLTLANNPNLMRMRKEDIQAAVRDNAPPPPYEAAAAKAADKLRSLQSTIKLPELNAAAERAKSDRAFMRLFLGAIVPAFGQTIDAERLVASISSDPRIGEAAAETLAEFGMKFVRTKGSKDLRSLYADTELLGQGELNIIQEHGRAIGAEETDIERMAEALKTLKPDEALLDYISMLVQAAWASGIAGRLESSLKNDSEFQAACSAS
ncbi:hypothetical protein [Tautonia plasticadhaerens]|uniref:Uncharacterized protein n=1 Tax=Tautonia plasticadhaerens TaxID=2527974 RepID=A0A518HBJ4_9BACT|nr:hypothetical protein [Tautonia plasticadhaerens]QDV38076.1 hypothetical protein ElP_60240 [Tautonia plasticadhaerens]